MCPCAACRHRQSIVRRSVSCAGERDREEALVSGTRAAADGNHRGRQQRPHRRFDPHGRSRGLFFALAAECVFKGSGRSSGRGSAVGDDRRAARAAGRGSQRPRSKTSGHWIRFAPIRWLHAASPCSCSSGFSLVASVLTLVGIYGVLSLSVAARRRDFAIRTAIGAQHRDIRNLVFAEGFRLIAGGVVSGISWRWCCRESGVVAVRSRAADPATLAGAGLLFAAVALLACWVPTRRAARVNPLEALRCE